MNELSAACTSIQPIPPEPPSHVDCSCCQVTRYGIAPGVSSSAIVEALDQRRQWVGAVSAWSPLRSSGSDGVSTRPMAYPMLLTADGRKVIATDSKTGDEVVLLRSFGRICKMVVCGGGDSVSSSGNFEGDFLFWKKS